MTTTLQYSSLGLRGSVSVDDDCVYWQCKYFWHGNLERRISLSTLSSDYLRSIGPANHLGTLLAMTLAALIMAVMLFADSAGNLSYIIAASLILLFSLLSLYVCYRYRREEWHTFYGVIPDVGLAYCKSYENASAFEAFTAELQSKILARRPSTNASG